MPTILHESQGLSIKRNDRNGFIVCRLHYTADPRKRSAEWKAAAQQGLPPSKFEKEFEINYQATMGQKAFPEILTKRSEIVVPEGPYFEGKWPSHLQMWGGFDYGANNPSCLTVYTLVDGVVWAIWEMYEPCRNLIDFTRRMKECPYWDQMRYIIHDPDMCSRKVRDMKTGDACSVRSQFETLGVTKWVPGVNDETAWLARMRQHWCGTEVTFKILPQCAMLIDEFEKATFITMSDRQLENSNYNESLRDKHNHALDACKYFMNGTVRATPKRVKLPDLVAAYSWGQHARPVAGREQELGLVI